MFLLDSVPTLTANVICLIIYFYVPLDYPMAMDAIHTDLHLRSRYDKHLLVLQDFEIVVVCDDSGSMVTRVKSTRKTRWEELCSIVKKVLEIAVRFDPNGVDIYFLNGGKYPKVKDPEQVDSVFARKPIGHTPLVPVLKEIFESPMARPGREKKLLVLVATDGKPTNGEGEDDVEKFEEIMNVVRNAETTYVSFLLCTDDENSMKYLKKWDRKMANVDVTDDYDTELVRIRKCQEDENFPFTKDDYIVKALIGSIIHDIDRLNEKK